MAKWLWIFLCMFLFFVTTAFAWRIGDMKGDDPKLPSPSVPPIVIPPPAQIVDKTVKEAGNAVTDTVKTVNEITQRPLTRVRM